MFRSRISYREACSRPVSAPQGPQGPSFPLASASPAFSSRTTRREPRHQYKSTRLRGWRAGWGETQTHHSDDGAVAELLLPGYEVVAEPPRHDAPERPVEHADGHDRDADEAVPSSKGEIRFRVGGEGCKDGDDVQVVRQGRGIADAVCGLQEGRDEHWRRNVRPRGMAKRRMMTYGRPMQPGRTPQRAARLSQQDSVRAKRA